MPTRKRRTPGEWQLPTTQPNQPATGPKLKGGRRRGQCFWYLYLVRIEAGLLLAYLCQSYGGLQREAARGLQFWWCRRGGGNSDLNWGFLVK